MSWKSWTQVSLMQFRRKLDPIEHIFKLKADEPMRWGREPLTTSIVQVITPVPSDEQVIQAWKSLRFLFPDIAMTADSNFDGSVEYTVPCPMDLKWWVFGTVKIIPAGGNQGEKNERDKVSSIDDLIYPPREAIAPMLYLFKETGQLLMRSGQWKFSIHSAVELSVKLLELIKNPIPEHELKWGEEVNRLGSFIPEPLDVAGLEERQNACKASGNEESNFPPLTMMTLPTRDNRDCLPGVTRLHVMEFSPKETSDINDACSIWEIDPATAMHASLIMAMQRVASSPGNGMVFSPGHGDNITTTITNDGGVDKDRRCDIYAALTPFEKHLVAQQSANSSDDGSPQADAAAASTNNAVLPLVVKVPCPGHGSDERRIGFMGTSTATFDMVARQLHDARTFGGAASAAEVHKFMLRSSALHRERFETADDHETLSTVTFTDLGDLDDKFSGFYKQQATEAAAAANACNCQSSLQLADWWCHVDHVGKDVHVYRWTRGGATRVQTMWPMIYLDGALVDDLMRECKAILMGEVDRSGWMRAQL